MWPARLVGSFCILQVRGSVGLVRMASGGTDRALNRLAQEKSPYLLQHASNPVDWYEQHTSLYYHTVFLFDRGNIIFISTCNRFSHKSTIATTLVTNTVKIRLPSRW